MYPTFLPTNSSHQDRSGTSGRRLAARRVVAGLLLCLGAAVALSLSGNAPRWTHLPGTSDLRAAASPLDALNYQIRTRYDDGKGGGCANARTIPAKIGIPQLVDVGGSAAKDLLVTVVAVPSVGGSPDILELVVNRVPLGEARARVEVVITPDSATKGRIAAGPDGCETGLPATFSATVKSSSSNLAVLAATVGGTKALTVLGSKYDDLGTSRDNVTDVSARLSPVPTAVTAIIDTVGPSSYRARVTTSIKTDLALSYTDIHGAARTTAKATVDKFPGALDLSFTQQQIKYTACAGMPRVTLDLETVVPTKRTSQMNVVLTDVPSSATLDRKTPSRFTFTTPGRVGVAEVTVADFNPGTTVPTLAPVAGQYLAARVEPEFTVARARILGLTRADIDVDDPVVVDVAHTEAPLTVVADLVELDGTVRQNTHLDLVATPLPATAKVTYSPTRQDFTYEGSRTIDDLEVDVSSSKPFVGNANRSHLGILSLPTGLSGQLDTNAKTFTSTMTDGGRIGQLEIQVTNGSNLRLPAGQQGLRVEDHVNSYEAFVRILGLEKATVGWGETKMAKLTHDVGSFLVEVHADEIDADGTDVDIHGLIQDLPHVALFAYGPNGVAAGDDTPVPQPVDPKLPIPHVGDYDQQEPGGLPAKSIFTYRGSADVAAVDFDVVSSTPLFGRATEAHLDLSSLSREVVVALFHNSKHADVITGDGNHGPGHLGTLRVELCAPTDCDVQPAKDPNGPSILMPSRDGLWVDELSSVYQAKIAITGLSALGVDWGDQVGVHLEHTKRPFDIVLNQDKPKEPVPGLSTGKIAAPPGSPGGPACPSGQVCEPPPINPTGCLNWRQCLPGEYPVPQIRYFSTHTDVTIEDLPAVTRVTYTPASQHITYEGSSEIAEIEVNHRTNGPPLVGGARQAHLVIEGLPTGVDLTTQFGGVNERLELNAGDASIRHIALDLTSAPTVLTLPSVAAHPVVKGEKDGLLFWDFNDFEFPTFEPIDDLFVIAVRASNVQRFYSALAPIAATGAVVTDRRIELTRQGANNPDIQVDIRRPNVHGQVHLYYVDPVDPNYKKAYALDTFKVTYTTPPNRLGFWVRQTQGQAQMLELKYWGSARGGPLDVYTDVGDKVEGVTIGLDRVPAGGGTIEAPGIDACFTADSMWCNYDHQAGGANNDEVSVSVRVSEPVRLDVDANVFDEDNDHMQILAGLDIERVLVASKEVRKEIDSNTFLWIDTEGYALGGDGSSPNFLKVYTGAWIPYVFQDGDRDMSIDIPPGTRAYKRTVELIAVNVLSSGIGLSSGSMVCPAGIRVQEDHGINLEHRLCPGPVINALQRLDGNPFEIARGQSSTVVVTGANFVPNRPGSLGSRVFVQRYNYDQGEWEIDPGIVLGTPVWIDHSRLELPIEVTLNASNSTRRVLIINPVDFPEKHDSIGFPALQ